MNLIWNGISSWSTCEYYTYYKCSIYFVHTISMFTSSSINRSNVFQTKPFQHIFKYLSTISCLFYYENNIWYVSLKIIFVTTMQISNNIYCYSLLLFYYYDFMVGILHRNQRNMKRSKSFLITNFIAVFFCTALEYDDECYG